jgi:hypothetical protein
VQQHICLCPVTNYTHMGAHPLTELLFTCSAVLRRCSTVQLSFNHVFQLLFPSRTNVPEYQKLGIQWQRHSHSRLTMMFRAAVLLLFAGQIADVPKYQNTARKVAGPLQALGSFCCLANMLLHLCCLLARSLCRAALTCQSTRSCAQDGRATATLRLTLCLVLLYLCCLLAR